MSLDDVHRGRASFGSLCVSFIKCTTIDPEPSVVLGTNFHEGEGKMFTEELVTDFYAISWTYEWILSGRNRI